MKNTLRIAVLLVGAGFVTYALYHLFFLPVENAETEQLYAMIGVGLLFIFSGMAMKKR